MLIGLGFVILSATSFVTYASAGPTSVTDASILNLNSSSYNYFYILSLFAYVLLFFINLPDRKGSEFYALAPLFFIQSPQFNLFAIVLLVFIAARNVFNFFKTKTQESFLVMFAFLMIFLFHVFLFLMPFGVELYLVAHIFLIAGFLSLLAMLVRVTKK